MKTSSKIGYIISRYMNAIKMVEHFEHHDGNYIAVHGDVDIDRIYEEISMEDSLIIYNYDCTVDDRCLKIETKGLKEKTIDKIMNSFDLVNKKVEDGVNRKITYTYNL